MTTASIHPDPADAAESTSAQVEGKLVAAWRKERFATHARGGLSVLLWLVVVILLSLVIDWLLLLPGYARVVLLAVDVAAIAWVAYRDWWRYLRPYDRLRTALKVERQHPNLATLLVSYVQMDEQDRAGASPRLLAAMRREAVEQTRPIDFRDIVDLSQLRKLAIFSLATFVLFAVLSVAWPSVFRTLAIRMFNPGATLSYPTRTHIASMTGDLTIPQGDPATVGATAQGVVPPAGTLYVKTDDSPWQELSLPMDGDGAFTHTFDQVLEGFRYYVRLGDAVSPVHQVQVVGAPTSTQTQVVIEYPPYTGAEPRTVETLNFDAIEGSTVTWRFAFDRPITSAQLVPADGEPKNMKLDGAGTTATLSLQAQQPLTYQLRWTDKAHGFEFSDPVQYRMQVVADRAPTVTLISPVDDGPGTLHKRVDLRFTVGDDFGLGEAWIIYAINGDEEQRHPLEPFSGVAAERSYTWRIGEALPALSVGDVLTYTVAVADNRKGKNLEPNVGRSSTRRLFVMSEPDYLNWIAQRKQGMYQTIQQMHESQTQAADEIELLENNAPGADQSP